MSLWNTKEHIAAQFSSKRASRNTSKECLANGNVIIARSVNFAKCPFPTKHHESRMLFQYQPLRAKMQGTNSSKWSTLIKEQRCHLLLPLHIPQPCVHFALRSTIDATSPPYHITPIFPAFHVFICFFASTHSFSAMHSPELRICSGLTGTDGSVSLVVVQSLLNALRYNSFPRRNSLIYI